MRNEKGSSDFTVVEVMIIIAIIGIFTAIAAGQGMPGKSPVKIFSDYSDGQRTGELVKFARKGLFWKTWEGELKLGEAQDNFWTFSLDEGRGHGEDVEYMAEVLQSSLGKKVNIRYVERTYWPTRTGSGYVAQKVDVVEPVSSGE